MKSNKLPYIEKTVINDLSFDIITDPFLTTDENLRRQKEFSIEKSTEHFIRLSYNLVRILAYIECCKHFVHSLWRVRGLSHCNGKIMTHLGTQVHSICLLVLTSYSSGPYSNIHTIRCILIVTRAKMLFSSFSTVVRFVFIVKE